jgi:hypothetical protein
LCSDGFLDVSAGRALHAKTEGVQGTVGVDVLLARRLLHYFHDGVAGSLEYGGALGRFHSAAIAGSARGFTSRSMETVASCSMPDTIDHTRRDGVIARCRLDR